MARRFLSRRENPQAGGGVELPSIRTDRERGEEDNDVFPLPSDFADPAGFQLWAFARAIEECDAEAQIRAYAERATLLVVDPDHPPRAPTTLTGKDEIASWIRDICSLRMTHRVVDLVDGGHLVAFTEHGRHRDGTQVLSTATAAIRAGLITRERVVMVWDGWD